MKLRVNKQIEPISSEVLARISIIRPILESLLYGIKGDVLKESGGVENIKLKMLPRSYRPGNGDIGFCFEWAIHDAISRQDPMVMDRLETAGKKCKLPGNNFKSILFGVEKSGKTKIIDTANEILTDDSRILSGTQAQPAKLKSRINQLAAEFHKKTTRLALPSSINGLWKSDLFFGTTDADRWLGVTLKINSKDLQAARGLRIGIIPSEQGKDDKVRKDESKNLIICPIPYDASFMELFYTGWRIVQQFIQADAQLPKEVNLPNPADRQVAKELEMRREFPVLDVIEALIPQSQVGLLSIEEKEVITSLQKTGYDLLNDMIITPVANSIK